MCYSPIHQQVPRAERFLITVSKLWAWAASRQPDSSVDEYCKHYTARLLLACSQDICHLHVDKAGDSRTDFHLCTRCFLGWQKAVCSLTVFLQPFLSSTALWLSKVLVSNITPMKNFLTEKTLWLLKLTRAVMTGISGFASLPKTTSSFLGNKMQK